MSGHRVNSDLCMLSRFTETSFTQFFSHKVILISYTNILIIYLYDVLIKCIMKTMNFSRVILYQANF